MRGFWLAVLFTVCGPAVAQDAAQVTQMQQQMLQQQITQQQLDRINQQQFNDSINAGLAGYRLGVQSPRLKQTAGTEPGTVIVSMDDPSPGASIFYTTDGWTPTAASKRYLGPITVQRSLTIRAVAMAAGGVRSRTSTWPIEATSKVSTETQQGPIRIAKLSAGTKLPLVFSASVSSRGQQVGNHLPVTLAEDLYIKGKVAAHKGAAVEAIVTHVDNSHVQGLPGILSISAQSLRLEDGTTIALSGVETMEGVDHMRKANIASIIPLGGLAVHGGDAIIPAGKRFDADVTAPSKTL